MIDYIGIHDVQCLIEEIGPGMFIERLAAEIEADYARWDEFEKSVRLASHSRRGVIELMPISDGRLYSFKYVNGHPGNTQEGLLTVMAFGVLAEVDTGYPILLSELTITTALRTAAMSALAARWLARPDSRSMALIGNGAQSEFQAIAFHRMLGIRELRLFDVDPLASAKLEQNLRAMPDLSDLALIRAPSIAEAVRGADIITTVTADKRNATILTPLMMAPGVHVNAVGGDCPGKTELHRDILARPNVRVVVEYEPQSRIEGEIQQMPPDFVVTEFAEIVRRGTPGRSSSAEITVFDSVGFALEDHSALRFLHGLVGEQPGRCRRIDLVPMLVDPKDLYGGTLGGGAVKSRPRRAA
ncbi:ornithine cyclodeaminase [Steroidobacter denitrificans]|uniref:Ornithine cyclodeaminase n=1 Tax=Steroidobacter denitrificans TaxID=465721 RepID=A0A127FAX5_STEDE|nr:ornithine cyclodeaminase [Steroidobacter denitrificans]AMN46745.1 ornithine cyclodeaminase [Steroidobacter denitrificans]